MLCRVALFPLPHYIHIYKNTHTIFLIFIKSFLLLLLLCCGYASFYAVVNLPPYITTSFGEILLEIFPFFPRFLMMLLYVI